MESEFCIRNADYYRGYRDGLIDAGYCPDCEDDAALCNYDITQGFCDEGLADMGHLTQETPDAN